MSEITLTHLEPRHVVGVRREVPVQALGAFFAEALPRVAAWVEANGVARTSMPCAVWWAMDRETGIADCQAGCFVGRPVEGDGEIQAGVTAGGEALTVIHTGPYDTVGRSWQAVYARAAELGREPGAGWEIYLDDPADTPADALRTHIHLPLV